jgi:hypothetical protein
MDIKKIAEVLKITERHARRLRAKGDNRVLALLDADMDMDAGSKLIPGPPPGWMPEQFEAMGRELARTLPNPA